MNYKVVINPDLDIFPSEYQFTSIIDAMQCADQLRDKFNDENVKLEVIDYE